MSGHTAAGVLMTDETAAEGERLVDHGLDRVLAIWLAGQTAAGLNTYNAERRQEGERELSIGQYLTSAHFGEATFETRMRHGR